MTIARTWGATATPEGAELYEAHFKGTVLPELLSLPGFRKAQLMRRPTGGRVELQVITIWESADAIMHFAGPAPDLAVVEPEAQRVLLGYDSTVRHYDWHEFGA